MRELQRGVFLSRPLSGGSAESRGADRLGRCPAAGPPAQPAERHHRGDGQAGPPGPHLPAQGAADPAVRHRLGVQPPRPERPGNQERSPSCQITSAFAFVDERKKYDQNHSIGLFLIFFSEKCNNSSFSSQKQI